MNKNVNKVLLKLILLFFIISTGIFFFQNNNQKETVENIGKDLANYASFKNRIFNTQLNINKKTVIIKMDIFEKFDSWSEIEQFAFLKYFVSQIRYTLKNLQDKNNYLSYDIKIKASSPSHNYTYISSVLDSASASEIEYTSSLSKNGKQMMTFDQFKKEVSNMNFEINLSETEKEIMNYGEHLFSLLTSNGRYYRPENDIRLIEDIVCEKYSLSSEEYLNIYRKAFVLSQ